MLREQALAKVNLSLHVLGRRTDGYHELESIVAFASIGDELSLEPGPDLRLIVDGETAEAAGPVTENLVYRAARNFGERRTGLQTGTFRLTKNLPVAAGLGGGSADAAAAIRLLARHNDLAFDDAHILAAAIATGADCTICLQSGPAFMRGIGHNVTPLKHWPELHAVLINPRIILSTPSVFQTLAFPPGIVDQSRGHPPLARDAMVCIATARNDLSSPARQLVPVITEVEAALASAGASLVRMSGSGATVFGLFPDEQIATNAARNLTAARPQWWIRATRLGGSRT